MSLNDKETTSEGFPMTSLREIALLKQLKHQNIIKLVDVVVGYKQDSVFLCFEYCSIDLANLVEKMTQVNQSQAYFHKQIAAQKPKMSLSYFTLGEIKCIMLQLVRAVAHLHEN